MRRTRTIGGLNCGKRLQVPRRGTCEHVERVERWSAACRSPAGSSSSLPPFAAVVATTSGAERRSSGGVVLFPVPITSGTGTEIIHDYTPQDAAAERYAAARAKEGIVVRYGSGQVLEVR
jgi:hypothetical protein